LSIQYGDWPPVAQLRSLTASSVTLTRATNDFSSLTNINGSSFSVSDQAVLTLTNVTTLWLTNAYLSFWVSDAGGLIDLSGVTNAVIGPDYYLSLVAQSGGRLDLHRMARPEGAVFATANYADAVVDLSAFAGHWALAPGASYGPRVSVYGGGQVLVGALTGLDSALLSIQYGDWPPVTQLRSLTASSVTLARTTNDFSSLTNINGSSFSVSDQAVLTLTNLTTLWLTNAALSFSVAGAGSLIDLSGVTNISVGWPYTVWVGAYNGGKIDLRNTDSIGGSCSISSWNSGSLVDLSNLSAFATPVGASSLAAQSGGVILLSDRVLLLVNVAVDWAGNSLVPPQIPASPSVSLYGRAWHSYWVVVRDTPNPASPWQLFARVPLTNDLEVISGPPVAWQAFRVWEFMADPAIVDLNRVAGGQLQLVLYGATNRSFRVETTNSLDRLPAGWAAWAETGVMTNTFRLFTPFTPTEKQRFYRGKQL